MTAGVDYLRDLFGRPRGRGVLLAAQALAGALAEREVQALAGRYMTEMLSAYEEARTSTGG